MADGTGADSLGGRMVLLRHINKCDVRQPEIFQALKDLVCAFISRLAACWSAHTKRLVNFANLLAATARHFL